ncbi:tRNA (guanosine(37)-N1)-methyltransferase TrmD [Staphylococcus sp. SQ8-PEA]|uniref:tRNA (guanine-N(1)-)-methyltransferase n=1 Tax=Staphylococcus marylandisciuri TaxID=2981529 RepID=A0ABT2QRZ0_9STAP|nr:tRNA (guanosine(37)-N1)-methyltransferase TrmD [Staphylococcus marylandisciuri]MCU5746723.1 tRNA (guanosine(37)-N1)-methyltransferase TrmD [Staphylococcus marylandisciuri]
MRIDYLTLFPEMFEGVLNTSILKRAQDKGMLEVNTINFRNYALNKHNQVDDYPFGGGQGMVLKPEPIFNAMEDIGRDDNTRVVLMCPQGEPFTQAKAQALSETEHIVFICGHYEGYDERIRTHLVTDEISIGDYVLTGGELPAMTMTDAIVRLIPGVLGNHQSHEDDSFQDGLLEFPQYTRPREFKGLTVPEVLLSGNHARIDKWRHEQKLIRTFVKRPDLLSKLSLNQEDEKILESYKKRIENKG